jgi:ABC-type multidrug transport system fused ATPase/permease subunit
MKINRSNFWNKLELISLIGMLLVGFLQICSLTFGKKIISYCLWPTLIIGFTVCLHNLITIKKFKKDKLLGFLLLFILTYVISIFFNFSYGYYDNLRTLVWFTMLVFIAYLNNSMHDDKSKNLYTIIYLVFLS